MEPGFWQTRWREGRIGFHQDAVTPLLARHWATIDATPGCRVFVPLCGKSLDMAWLAARGHRVLGVELSPLAVGQFFSGHGLSPTVTRSRLGEHHVAGGIEIIVGDAFDLDRQALSGCAAVFDRAALIALPPDLRRRYAEELYRRLPGACRGLLLTLEYPQHEMAGPPFAVMESEVRELYGAGWRVEVLERRESLASEPRFAEDGVSALEAVAYRLEHSDAPQARS